MQMDADKLKIESEKLKKLSNTYAKFYDTPKNVDLLDITQILLDSPYVMPKQKRHILTHNRRIFVFTYKSDGLKIKGAISFVPDAENQSTLVLLRGGNQKFGVISPAEDLMCLEKHTIIATMYRDGVSEGSDEFGGADVNDVFNLVKFLPQLQKKLNTPFQMHNMYLLGKSRGGMQLFLTLARYPELQEYFIKVISLSGLLDMNACILKRPDMKEMFIKDFGLIEGVNDQEWIAHRNPLLTISKIKKDLPIVILQGGKDNRIGLEEGQAMLQALQAAGHRVTYQEYEEGEHCLYNLPQFSQIILEHLNKC